MHDFSLRTVESHLSSVESDLAATATHMPSSYLRLLALLVIFVALALPAAIDDTDGADLYEKACAACHGTDGRGRDTSAVGFEIPLPDFTDCAFASREPDADWFAVVHEGGPIRAFDRMMPAFGDALEADHVEAILSHVRSFCTNHAWPPGEFNLPRPVFTEKAFPEDEAVVTMAYDTTSDTTELELLYEKRIGPRGMVEVAVPLHYSKSLPSGGRDSFGLGNVKLGYKHTMYHHLDEGSIVAAGFEFVLPTDEGIEDIDDETIFESYVAYGRLLPSDAFIQVQALAEVGLQGVRDDEVGLRFAAGKTWTRDTFGRAWSPMLEILATRQLGSNADTRLDIIPQVQVSLNKRQHVLLNLGLRFPDDGARDPQLVFYVLWDWFDGGLFDGWGR